MPNQPQSFENHAMVVPAYHYLAFGLVTVNLLWNLYETVVAFSVGQLVSLLAAVALAMTLVYARIFALQVQDRVIRLEMRLRLATLAPDLGVRFDDFTVNQLCSLRFASDGELPVLARKVLSERLDNRKAIKQQIRDWQGDYWRV